MSNFEVEVIGAGWGRTGTASLKKALEILGYPCYHMFEVMGRNHHDFWIRVADGKEYDFNEVFVQPDVKFTATVDFPSSQYWREQLRRYPNAKVILSHRDEEKWYKSCMETIFCMIGGSPHVPFGVWLCRSLGILVRRGSVMTNKVISRDAFHGKWDKDSVIDSYKKHNAAVIAECPAEKLLVFEVSEGWGPLCAFLGKPIPDQPFPHVNDTAQFRARVQHFNTLGCMIAGLVLPGLLGLGLQMYRSRGK